MHSLILYTVCDVVPPLVTVRPSNVALQDYNDRLHISCSVYSLESAISWYKNNEPLRSNSKTTIEGNKLTKAYLSVDNTPDDVNHYTCEAVNSDGLSSRATVSVVLRGQRTSFLNSRFGKFSM